MLESPIANVGIQTLKKPYTAQVKDLLITSQLSAKEIAEFCGCSYQLVTYCRRQLNLPHVRQTQQQMLSRLQRELQELRREVMLLDDLLNQDDNSDASAVQSITRRTSQSNPAVCITTGKPAGSKN